MILKDDKICRLYHKQVVSSPLKFIAVSVDGFALLIKIFKFLVSQNLKVNEKLRSELLIFWHYTFFVISLIHNLAVVFW